MLEVRDLTVRYGAIEALHGINLKVEDGSIVTLIGANGAGKTTCLRTISGLHRPSGGRILLDGEDLGKRPPHEIVRRGVV